MNNETDSMDWIEIDGRDSKNYLSVENTNLLTIGPIFPHSILQIRNSKGELLFDMRQNEDGTIKTDLYNLDEAATLFFNEVLKRSQDYALSYLKDRVIE